MAAISEQIQQANTVFELYESAFGINIPQASTENIERLIQEVGIFFSEDTIAAARTAWAEVTTKFRATHISNQTPSIIAKETVASTYLLHGKQAYSHPRAYCVFASLEIEGSSSGVGWTQTRHHVSVDLSAAMAEDTNPYPGLFISPHWMLAKHPPERVMPAAYFGDTKRSMQWSAGSTAGTIEAFYNYPDGTTHTEPWIHQHLFFSAFDGIGNIFEALLLLVLKEIGLIGHAFKAEFKSIINDHDTLVVFLEKTYTHCFVSEYFPEAKFPYQIKVDAPYVTVREYTEDEHRLTVDMDTAVKMDHVETVAKILEHASHLFTPDILGQYLASRMGNASGIKTVTFLLKHGASLIEYEHPKSSKTLIETFIKHSRARLLHKLIIKGMPCATWPSIRRTLNLRHVGPSRKSAGQIIKYTGSQEVKDLINSNISAPEPVEEPPARTYESPKKKSQIEAAAMCVIRYDETGTAVVPMIRRYSRAGLYPVGSLYFPGGIVDRDEFPEEAAVREAEEEIRAACNNPQHIATFSGPKKLLHFYADTNPKHQALSFHALDDAAVVHLVPVDTLTPDENGIYRFDGIVISPSNMIIIRGCLSKDKAIAETIQARLQFENELDAQLQTYFNLDDFDAFSGLVIVHGIDISSSPFLSDAFNTPDKLSWVIPLCELGADVDAIISIPEKFGWVGTPLMASLFIGDWKLAETLIEKHHANLNAATTSNLLFGEPIETRVLQVTVYMKKIKWVKLLIEKHGAKLSCGYGYAAIVTAVTVKAQDILAYLLAMVENGNINPNQDEMLLEAVLDTASLTLFKELRQHGLRIFPTPHFNPISHIDTIVSRYIDELRRLSFRTELDTVNISDTNVVALMELRNHIDKLAPNLVPLSCARTTISSLFLRFSTEVIPTQYFLVVRKAGSTQKWQLPTTIRINNNTQTYFTFTTSFQFGYQHRYDFSGMVQSDSEEPQANMDSEGKEYRWVKYEPSNDYANLPETPILASDAYFLNNVQGDLAPNTLNHLIYWRLFGHHHLLLAYLQNDREAFLVALNEGANINTTYRIGESVYLPRLTIIDFDSEYNEGQWADFLVSHGATLSSIPSATVASSSSDIAGESAATLMDATTSVAT